jgi:hypothetical protein
MCEILVLDPDPIRIRHKNLQIFPNFTFKVFSDSIQHDADPPTLDNAAYNRQ